MYRELDAQIARAGLDKKKLAQAAGMAYSTLLGKCNGLYDFTFSECCTIRKIVAPNMSLDELFKKF